MKPFDIDKAKAGAKLCTRSGLPARIVCYDQIGNYPIVVQYVSLLNGDGEFTFHDKDGKASYCDKDDLMLADDND